VRYARIKAVVFFNQSISKSIIYLLSSNNIIYQLQPIILLMYEASRDSLSEWTSLNTWFINVIFRFPVS